MVTTFPQIGTQPSRSRSRKVYVTGSREDLRVPFREVEQSPTPAEYGVERNAPLTSSSRQNNLVQVMYRTC